MTQRALDGMFYSVSGEMFHVRRHSNKISTSADASLKHSTLMEILSERFPQVAERGSFGDTDAFIFELATQQADKNRFQQ